MRRDFNLLFKIFLETRAQRKQRDLEKKAGRESERESESERKHANQQESVHKTAKYLCHSLSIMSDINPLVEMPM